MNPSEIARVDSEQMDRLGEAAKKTAIAFEALYAYLPPAGSMAAGPRLKPMTARKRRRREVRASRRANR